MDSTSSDRSPSANAHLGSDVDVSFHEGAPTSQQRELPRGWGQHSNAVGNDSFGVGATGSVPELASTRPFGYRDSPAAANVERFLTTPGLTAAASAARSADLTLAENSSFVSIPKTLPGEDHSSPPVLHVPTTSHEPHVMVPTPQRTTSTSTGRHPRPSTQHVDPLMVSPQLSSKASSAAGPYYSGGPHRNTSFAETVAPRDSPISIPHSDPESPCGQDSRGFPVASRGPPSGSRGPPYGRPPPAAEVSPPRSTVLTATSGPVLVATAASSVTALPPPGAALAGAGASPPAGYRAMGHERQPMGGPPVPSGRYSPSLRSPQAAWSSGPASGGGQPGLAHARSEVELQHYFAQPERAPTTAAGAFYPPPSPQQTPSSAGSKRRAQGSTVSASAAGSGRPGSPGGGGGVMGGYPAQPRPASPGNVSKPQWASAVERLKRTGADRKLYNPVLPLEQSKLGWNARKAGQQGTLTAQQLRAFEESYNAQVSVQGGASGGGGSVPFVTSERAYGGSVGSGYGAGSAASASRSSPQGALGAGPALLVAQEETYQACTRHHRAVSEPAGVRRAHVRTGHAANLASVGRGTPPVLVATETSASPVRPAAFATAASSVGGQGSVNSLTSKLVSVEQKVANLFAGRPDGSPGPTLTSRVAAGSWEGKAGAASEAQPSLDTTPGGRGSKESPQRGSKKDSNVHACKSEDVKKTMAAAGDDDERDETAFRSRNINALHAIPWDERGQIPLTGFGTRFFSVLSSPRFWEKLDWAFRGSILTIFPTMVLSLEPTTATIVPPGFASMLAFQAFWITAPTFGSGLRELIIVLKGFSFGLVLLLILVAIHPGPAWVSILILFFFTLAASFISEETKKTVAYVLASTTMQYVSDPQNTNYYYIMNYYVCLLIASAFGTAAFLVPFVRWSSQYAKHYISAMGNALSIDIQGTCSSFWVRIPLERQLNVMRLRQLRATAEACISRIESSLNDSDYEPHLGRYRSKMKRRFAFCISIHNILGSMSALIELLSENPSLIDTPMCTAFGAAIDEDLAIISSAMDSMVLKIVDFHRTVTPAEIFYFSQAREAFQQALSRVREEVILTNEDYETDESDIFLGFFMFSVDELCETIANFEEDPEPPNSLVHALLFPIRDIQSVYGAFRNLYMALRYRGTITRRLKEAIKLSLCMVVPTIFQVYALSNSPTSAMAGASIIALCYNPTGSESFHYATGRLLGTVVGSISALMVVQIADMRRWVLYIFVVVIGFIGAYVQAAPGFYALGNAICCSMISIITQYRNNEAAITRINQNCFAIIIYFAIITVLWPMQGRTKVKMGLDVSLRCLRESVARMLRNLDMPDDANVVMDDVSALLKEMSKKVGQQTRFLSGALEEPTLSSTAFPEEEWRRIIAAERKMLSALSMMRYAYQNFMSSRADDNTNLSVHWVVLHRIAPHACDLSDLIFAAVDLYLLSLGRRTQVPTTHLTKLRAGMMEAHQAILDVYIKTIQRTIDGNGDDERGGGHAGGPDYTSDGGGDGDDGSANFSGYEPALITSLPQAGDPAVASSTVGTDAASPVRGAAESAFGAGSPTGAGAAAVHGKPLARPTGAPDGEDAGGGGAEAGKAGKKRGYFSYNLTKEEEETLKHYVASRANNGIFSNNATLTNSTFTNRNMSITSGGALAAAVAANALGGGPQSAASGAAKVFSVTGADDDLVSRLRKKHRIKEDPKKGDGDDENNASSDLGPFGRKVDLDQLEALVANNGSFLRNSSFFQRGSLLGNNSFLGGLFKRRAKGGEQEGGDMTEVNQSAVLRPGDASGPDHRRKSRDKANDSDGEDDDGAEGKGETPIGSKPRKGRRRSAKPSEYSAASATRAGTVSSKTSTAAEGDARSGREESASDVDDPRDTATAEPVPSPGLASSLPADPHSPTSAGPGNTLPRAPDPPKSPTAGPVSGARGRPEKESRRSSGSSAEGSGGTVRKTVSLQTAVSDPKVSGEAGKAPKAAGSPGQKGYASVTKDGYGSPAPVGRRALGSAANSLSSANRFGASSSGLAMETRSQPFFGGSEGGPGLGPTGGSELLENVSFFDAEKGEFVLTNHDIHSLEAFLFGTRAIVVHMNELQNAIIDMQHASELAKKL